MPQPFAHVLYIDRGSEEHLVSLHRRLDQAEAALRAFVATVFVGPAADSEIVESLADAKIHVRLFACTWRRGKQVSTELEPFAHAAKVA
jgi:hypothetical protein